MLIIDRDAQMLYELFAAEKQVTDPGMQVPVLSFICPGIA
jgi:hypothetical protein